MDSSPSSKPGLEGVEKISMSTDNKFTKTTRFHSIQGDTHSDKGSIFSSRASFIPMQGALLLIDTVYISSCFLIKELTLVFTHLFI